MENRLIKAKEIGNYRIKIYYDIDAMCPCTDWDMAACFLWEYDCSARLSDACNWREVFGKYGDSDIHLQMRYIDLLVSMLNGKIC